jgi:hypothetical protein
MSNVLHFKRAGILPHHRKTDTETVHHIKTHDELFSEIQDKILWQWAISSRQNELNKFIASHIPEYAAGIQGSDYVNNISDIALVEQKLNINPIIFGPSSSVNNPNGWLVASNIGQQMIFTPNDMQSEASARSYHLLLFILFTYATQS